jgi:AraC-like DNA-binding protein
MTEDALIIKEYREAFRKYAKDGIIDMDNRLRLKFNFQIHHLEDYVRELQGIIPPNRQSQIFIGLVTDGTGEKTIGHFTFPIHKDLLFIVPERVVHSSKYWCDYARGYFLSFNIEFFLQNAFPKHHIADKKIFRRSIRPYLNLTPDQTSKLQTIFEYLMEEYTGLTAKETIDDYIVTEAKFLLHSSSLTIKEIAYELGFNNPDQFSTFFRKRLQLSPSHYKLHPIHYPLPNQRERAGTPGPFFMPPHTFPAADPSYNN